eukprot:232370-Rhodomonas_salina.1
MLEGVSGGCFEEWSPVGLTWPCTFSAACSASAKPSTTRSSSRRSRLCVPLLSSSLLPLLLPASSLALPSSCCCCFCCRRCCFQGAKLPCPLALSHSLSESLSPFSSLHPASLLLLSVAEIWRAPQALRLGCRSPLCRPPPLPQGQSNSPLLLHYPRSRLSGAHVCIAQAGACCLLLFLVLLVCTAQRPLSGLRVRVRVCARAVVEPASARHRASLTACARVTCLEPHAACSACWACTERC